MSTEPSGGYSIARRDDAPDPMAQWPGYGEQRWYSDARGRTGVVQLAAHAARDWRPRQLLPSPSGQEEIHYLISGAVTFKVTTMASRPARRRLCG